MQDFAFILLAAAVIVSSFLAVTLSNLLHAALAFMVSLFFTAVLVFFVYVGVFCIFSSLVFIAVEVFLLCFF